MTQPREQDENPVNMELDAWLRDTSHEKSLRERLTTFNAYLLEKAKESGVGVAPIIIVDTIWNKSEAIVLEAIHRQLTEMLNRPSLQPDQLPPPEV